MSALHTLRIVKPQTLSSFSPSSSSHLQSLAVRVTFFPAPKKVINNRHLSLNSAKHLPNTLVVKSAESSSAMADSNSSCLDPEVAEIIVVRHGETEWNADCRIQGHLDVMLNDVGRQQAVLVAERLSKEPKVSAVYSSDLKRAFETAETIARRCGVEEVIKCLDLRERHLGELQGLVYQEAAKSNPKAYRALLSHRTDEEIPGGGESLDQLFDRCTSALERISQKHEGERVVVVTHGGVIRSLYERACPNGRSKGKVLNTSVNIFHLSYGDKWVLKSWGDVSHLDGVGFLLSGFGGDKTSG